MDYNGSVIYDSSSLILWIANKFRYGSCLRITGDIPDIQEPPVFSFLDNTDNAITYDTISKVVDAMPQHGILLINHMIPEDVTDLRFQPMLRLLSEREDIIITTISDIDGGVSIVRKTQGPNPFLKRNIQDWDINGWSMEGKMSLINPISIKDYIDRCNEVVICAIAKQELQYLTDWIMWHKNLGFDRIYLFDNNDLDGENYAFLEDDLRGFVKVIDVRGMPGVQTMMYNMFFLRNMYKWVAVIDLDEFIKIDNDKFPDIKSFINSMPEADQIILRWQCYKANPSNEPIRGHIWDYCTEPVEDATRISSKTESIHGWFKSITKSGFTVQGNEHICWNIDGKNLRKYNSEGVFMEMFHTPDVYGQLSNKVAVINHYIVKNIREFYYNKYKRGHAGLGGFGNKDGIIWFGWCQNLQYYNEIQHTLSKEEQEFIISKGYKPIWTFCPDIAVSCHVDPVAQKTCSDKSDVMFYLYAHAYPRTWILKNSDAEQGFDAGPWNWVAREMWLSSCASSWMVDFSDLEWKNGQKELFINLGYDVDNILKEDPEEYDGKLFIRSDEEFKDVCQRVLEDPKLCVVASVGIERDANCGGYKDVVDKFCEEYGVSNKGLRFKSNTYLTSIDMYNKVKECWGKFVCDGFDYTQDIVNSHKKGEKSPRYGAWQFCYPCLFDNIYEIN